MTGEYNFEIENGSAHPQFFIIKKHIERAVQDTFLIALRGQNDEILYIFNKIEQIPEFRKKIILYWEEMEEYEICNEIIDLTRDLEERWKKKIEVDQEFSMLNHLKDLFDHSNIK